MLEIHKTPLDVYTEFQSKIIKFDQDMLLSGLALYIEHDDVTLRPKGSDIVVGVDTDLPDNLKLSDLAEALHAGKGAFVEIVAALVRMVSTSSRPDQRRAMDEAMDRLADFSQFLTREPAKEEG